ncbi:MAG: hypothetical protein A2931_02205 [Candidatus Niyogibacteria bacterium RIFCSPLOWO2_01_FULL_45_48]|uniref:Uncharacterized protein n=2 Tax=Candidatus Niyogiibacteriota TaxID=1817912 RepID=A0A1G2EY81_9BACT|nr:MAG: hypothetical protein A3J00_03885 [Candidatus Niyogibacteria bacterium RIFCSPLOWO2_02_FULL_45_13]OGZ31277.1 MAG: hypothetical protein A2931_02205 [Candidatus Niyogibacteria bacterium RIFCSPLOWO2_01_FULL_45_48]
MNNKDIKEELNTIAYHTHWTRQNTEWIDYKVGAIKTMVKTIMIVLFVLTILMVVALTHFW